MEINYKRRYFCEQEFQTKRTNGVIS